MERTYNENDIDFFSVIYHKVPESVEQAQEQGRFLRVQVDGKSKIIDGNGILDRPFKNVLQRIITNPEQYTATCNNRDINQTQSLRQQQVTFADKIILSRKYSIGPNRLDPGEIEFESYSRGKNSISVAELERLKQRYTVVILQRNKPGRGGQVKSLQQTIKPVPKRAYGIETQTKMILSILPYLRDFRQQSVVTNLMSRIQVQPSIRQSLRASSNLPGSLYRSCLPQSLDVLNSLNRQQFCDINSSILIGKSGSFGGELGDKLQMVQNALKIMPRQRQMKKLTAIGRFNSEQRLGANYFCSAKIQMLYDLKDNQYEKLARQHPGMTIFQVYTKSARSVKELMHNQLTESQWDLSRGPQAQNSYLLMHYTFFRKIGDQNREIGTLQYKLIQLRQLPSPRSTNVLLWLGSPMEESLRVQVQTSNLFPHAKNNINYSVLEINREEISQVFSQFKWITRTDFVNLKVVIRCSQMKLAEESIDYLKRLIDGQWLTNQVKPRIWCNGTESIQLFERMLQEINERFDNDKYSARVISDESEFKEYLTCPKTVEETPCCLLF